ncbi:hypothetical protein NLO413_0514 [Candidatus Neoehrlichia lotoris str. RAC413]|uniref:Uncharacterized protein n=1 Tax=Candidatus Neoehrlichia procyonis str. RAC413 TaxID=1359163 RepID=A0A0F3NM59_9RICK|nr:hypothetical protein NLO413_0514 [Candidatus Neoehrlichia lotoris str. RAC413]
MFLYKENSYTIAVSSKNVNALYCVLSTQKSKKVTIYKINIFDSNIY